MPINRRQFIKRSAGAVTVSLLVPKSFIGAARSQATTPMSRRILVVIELAGGNDGLNTVIPYTDAQYHQFRPMLGFRDTELKDAPGNSTILNDRLGLHPSMGKLKQMYDAGRVAIVLGAGYPNPSGSHFESADIWHAGKRDDVRIDGWLGRYVETVSGAGGLSAVAIEDKLPKTFASRKVVVPNIPNFDDFGLQTDSWHPDNRENKIRTLLALNSRNFPAGSFLAEQARIGFDAVNGALQFKEAVDKYTSTIKYPDNNPLAEGLRMLAKIITTIPESSLLYVQMGGFDNHSEQIPRDGNKRAGQHATLLQYFSEGVESFYRDMAEHGLADEVLMMQWSEFGRRPEENKSVGTDHGAASCLFVIGNGVTPGIYGKQPSLADADLDDAGNLKFDVDFRSVYSTIIDRWLGGDSKTVLGGNFENIGFLG